MNYHLQIKCAGKILLDRKCNESFVILFLIEILYQSLTPCERDRLKELYMNQKHYSYDTHKIFEQYADCVNYEFRHYFYEALKFAKPLRKVHDEITCVFFKENVDSLLQAFYGSKFTMGFDEFLRRGSKDTLQHIKYMLNTGIQITQNYYNKYYGITHTLSIAFLKSITCVNSFVRSK